MIETPDPCLCATVSRRRTLAACATVPSIVEDAPGIDIDNGNFTCDVTASGSTCTATCNAGFAGRPRITCVDGYWSAVEGACTAGKLNVVSPILAVSHL
jgi:hypothetical protein